jgi:hypothetical protein
MYSPPFPGFPLHNGHRSARRETLTVGSTRTKMLRIFAG